MDFVIANGALTAAVIVRDPGLRMSLKLMLETCGITTTEAATIDDFLAGSDLAEDAIFVDGELIGRSPNAFLDPLCSRGWTGLVVAMAEEEDEKGLSDESHEQYVVLVKPFTPDEVISIVKVISSHRGC